MFINQGSEAEMRQAIWAQVCTDYYQPALDLARWRVGNIDDACVIVQDSVVRLLRLSPDPNRISDRKNYWIKTVQNQCYEALRKRKVEAALVVSRDTPPQNDEGDELPPPDPSDSNRDPEMNAIINEETERLLRELEMKSADLTEREKALLDLHLVGYSNDEVASMWSEDVKLIRVDMNAVVAKIRYRLRHPKK